LKLVRATGIVGINDLAGLRVPWFMPLQYPSATQHDVTIPSFVIIILFVVVIVVVVVLSVQ